MTKNKTQEKQSSEEEILTCPVMKGIPINKEESEDNGWVREYKGKKIYLCCNGCVEQFDAEPEAYAEP